MRTAGLGTPIRGAAPVTAGYVDRGDPAGLDFSIGSGLTADGTWRTLDLSSIVPAAAASKLVHLRCEITNPSSGTTMQFRTLGNTKSFNNAIAYTQVADEILAFDAWVTMDADRKVQYHIDSLMSSAQVTVAGWAV